MRYRDVPAYLRSLKSIKDARRREAVHQAVSRLIECFEQKVPPPIGLGLKQLRPPIWEIRSSLHDRIAFLWSGDLITFLAAGSHDDIRRLLARSRA